MNDDELFSLTLADTKTAEQFWIKYIEILIMLLNSMNKTNFKKTLKIIYTFLPIECQESFKDFYSVNTDRRVLNRIFKTLELYIKIQRKK